MRGHVHGTLGFSDIWESRGFQVRAYEDGGAWIGEASAGPVRLLHTDPAPTRAEAISLATGELCASIKAGIRIDGPVSCPIGEARETFLGGFEGRTLCARWVRPVPCGDCEGTGYDESEPGRRETCFGCGGSGSRGSIENAAEAA